MSKIDFNSAFLNGFGKEDRRPKKVRNPGMVTKGRKSIKSGFSGDSSVLTGRDLEIVDKILSDFNKILDKM